MPDRHVPVRPNLDQLRHQAKDLLRGVRRGEPGAIAEFTRNHPAAIPADRARLSDAQLALARAYGVACSEYFGSRRAPSVAESRRIPTRPPTHAGDAARSVDYSE